MARVGECRFCKEIKGIVGKGFCRACYQRNYKNGSPDYVKIRKPCKIEGCEVLSEAKELCHKHYKRFERHGHTGDTRPKGWGAKESHPLHQIWMWKRRTKDLVIADEWLDFWQFVQDVGERPGSEYKMVVIDKTKPFYKDNYEWLKGPIERRDGETDSEFRSRYGKHWRDRNWVSEKDKSLRRMYGITIDTFNEMKDRQKGLCMICSQEESKLNPHTGLPRELAVDHNKDTGKVRGLLCTDCNTGIGLFLHDDDLTMKAALYLEAHK